MHVMIVQYRFAVPALAGEAADGDDSGIRESLRLLKERGRNLRLHRHARRRAVCILLRDVFFIEV